MISRHLYSASMNEAAAQRTAMDLSRQRVTRLVWRRTPECALSITFVVPRHRRSAGGKPSSLTVKSSSSPSLRLPAAFGCLVVELSRQVVDHVAHLVVAHSATRGRRLRRLTLQPCHLEPRPPGVQTTLDEVLELRKRDDSVLVRAIPDGCQESASLHSRPRRALQADGGGRMGCHHVDDQINCRPAAAVPAP